MTLESPPPRGEAAVGRQHLPNRVIGIDVGGTKVAMVVLHGVRRSAPLIVETATAGPEQLVQQLIALVERAGPARAVGIGVPSIVDSTSGIVRASTNVPLQAYPLGSVLSSHLRTPVFVENDANLAALGEAHGEDMRPIASTVVLLTIGTGVGGGIVIDGRLHRGATGAAGEIGQQVIADSLELESAAASRFPRPGTLEALASGKALDGLARAAGFRDGRDVARAAASGVEAARDCMDAFGHRVGIGVANIINTLDPDRVVLGGGVASSGELLLRPVRRTAWRFVLPGVGSQTKITGARYGSLAGARGAALYARTSLARLRRGA